MAILLLFTLPIEAGPFIRRLNLSRADGAPYRYTGSLNGIPLIVAITGMGGRRAGEAIDSILADFRPSAILCSGFAGALESKLACGDIVVADYILSPDAKERQLQSCDSSLVRCARSVSSFNPRVGPLLARDTVVGSPKGKAALGALHDCIAVDMESAAAASAATSHGVRFGVVRSILDRVDDTIPSKLADIVKPTGEPDIRKLFASLATRPRLLLDLLTLHRMTIRAGRTLADFLIDYIPRIEIT